MDCQTVRKILMDLLGGDVSGARKDEAETHIQACPRCREERALLEKSWQMLDRYDAPLVKPGFTESLMDRIREEKADESAREEALPLRFWFPSLRLTAVMASLVVAAFAAFVLWELRTEETQIVQPLQPEPVQIIVEKVPEIPAPEAVAQVDGPPAVMEVALSDQEVIANLDLYQDEDLLKDLSFLSEMDVVEDLQESETSG